MNQANSSAYTKLSPELRKAQDAINHPEVREIVRRLAKYGLGVYMPHAHSEKHPFAAMPDDIIQVEQANEVSFGPSSSFDLSNAVPVGWRWSGEGETGDVRVFAMCEHE